MVTIFVVILCILIAFVTLLILCIYFETVKERRERQEYAIELMERLQLKVFLLKADLTDFTEKNNLAQVDFFYDFTFNNCIASLERIESKCTDSDLLFTLKTSKREKQINSIISDCKYWMLYIDRISNSLDKKSRNQVYDIALGCVG